MKDEKTWELACGGSITVQDKQRDFNDVDSFRMDINLGSWSEALLVHKRKSTIVALRKMCDWMEKRL